MALLYCEACGAKLSMEDNYCPRCGKDMISGRKECMDVTMNQTYTYDFVRMEQQSRRAQKRNYAPFIVCFVYILGLFFPLVESNIASYKVEQAYIIAEHDIIWDFFMTIGLIFVSFYLKRKSVMAMGSLVNLYFVEKVTTEIQKDMNYKAYGDYYDRSVGYYILLISSILLVLFVGWELFQYYQKEMKRKWE